MGGDDDWEPGPEGPPKLHQSSSEEFKPLDLSRQASGWSDAGGWEADPFVSAKTTYPGAQDAVDADIAEVAIVPKYRALPAVLGDKSYYNIRLALEAESLGLGSEQAFAVGLGTSKFILVEIIFPAAYTKDIVRPKAVVGIADDITADISEKKFQLSWPLQDRLKTKFEVWPPELPEREVSLKSALSLMEVADIDIITAAALLKHCKNDYSKAAVILSEGTMTRSELKGTKDKLMKEVKDKQAKAKKVAREKEAKEKASKSPFANYMAWFAGSSGDDGITEEEAKKIAADLEKEEKKKEDNINTIMELFSIDYKVAEMAFRLEGTLEKVVDLLSDETSKLNIIAIVRGEEEEEDKKSEEKEVEKSFSISETSFLEEFMKPSNYLLQILQVLEDSIRNIDSHCLVCDKPLAVSAIKPTICDEKMCIVRYEELGLGFSLEDEIFLRPMVSDLLISFCAMAATTGRLKLFFPKGVGEVSGKKILSDVDVCRILDVCPSIEEMQILSKKGKLIEFLNSKDTLLLPLLKWLFTTNRSHLRPLEKSERIESIIAPHQFVLLSSSPAKEATFQELKKGVAASKAFGIPTGKPSIYAFHGSPAGNWHTIIRTGLKNMSNTENMLHGAAYGPGIYAAANSDVATGLVAAVRTATCSWGSRSIFGMDWGCYAICEIVNASTVKAPAPHYVIQQEELVATRFLCVMPITMIQPSIPGDSLKVPDISAKTYKRSPS